MKAEQITDFVKAVSRMRYWQKTYFKTRHPGAIQEAKRWEKEVDRFIADEEQPGLFQ